ncbi:putative leucine-rich repeat receptor-like protein kinase IMK3 [Glycine soja]|uniref:Putative leucine-rich repeat receptor-like protein kinase IMK3 n=1 Tax=Glycine soja TaxID=3848 RepID=A0A445ILH0_GLYSO|nr:putative leucine-rich repeat receptor-like protein kinase IMK3 [Glycine soja]
MNVQQNIDFIKKKRVSDLSSVTTSNGPLIFVGWSVKAIVSRILFECLENENVSIVTEKEVQTLSSTNESELLEAVIKTVNECVAEVPRFGFEEPKSVLGTLEVYNLQNIVYPFATYGVLAISNGDHAIVQLQQKHSNGQQQKHSNGHYRSALAPIQEQQQEQEQPSRNSTLGVVVTTNWELFDSIPPLIHVPFTSPSPHPSETNKSCPPKFNSSTKYHTIAKGHITERIGQLRGLRKLSLHDNQIGGSIPSALGLLLNLRGVQLFKNRFTGTTPPSLGSCPLLQSLDLSNNLLTRTIPMSLGNATKLYWLNFSFNSLGW